MGANWCGEASGRLRALGRARGSTAPPGSLCSAFRWARCALRGEVRVMLEPGGTLHSRSPGSWGSPPTSARLRERTCGLTETPGTLCTQATPVKGDPRFSGLLTLGVNALCQLWRAVSACHLSVDPAKRRGGDRRRLSAGPFLTKAQPPWGWDALQSHVYF